ncbi:GDP dissociation inhibitor family protein / RabGTPase activator family protein [Striga asiatica]|uniref:GDP dissociation inhibitor family protein / RabGTPase activator family protein n=1 Tax=Striga asiatica TaxID=4170 RepID=A0A5A7QYJ4_STRAF|nr:GDP dissociation inhibitor family protein / RabGTPase activator family protein [Striga asiatica]
MFRAMSTRRSRNGYVPLREEAVGADLVPKLSRTTSTQAKILTGCSKKIKCVNAREKTPAEEEKEAIKKASKIHPLFGLFETRRKKKPTANPKFSKYLEYLKEGGTLGY